MRTKIQCVVGVLLAVAASTAAFTTVAQEPKLDSNERQRLKADIDALKQQNQELQRNNFGAAFSPRAPVAAVPQVPGLNPLATNNLDPFSNSQAATLFVPGRTRFDPALARVNNASNQKVVELIQKLKGAEGEDVKLELKEEIKQLLEEQYDAYLTHHEAPLKQLEDRLEKLREEFESRKQAKDDLVKLRLDTIWYDAMGLGWPEDRRSGAFSWRQPMQTMPAMFGAPPAGVAAPNFPGAAGPAGPDGPDPPDADAAPRSPRRGR